MTGHFKFQSAAEPSPAQGVSGAWGGLSAALETVNSGSRVAESSVEHKVIFYLGAILRADVGIDGIRHQRLQAAGHFDLLPAGCDPVHCDEPCERVSIRLTPALLVSTAESMGLAKGPVAFAAQTGMKDAHVEHLVRAVLAELQAPAPAGRLFMDALAVALATRLLQLLARVGGVAERHGLPKRRLRRIVNYVENNLESDLSLAQIAVVAGLSVPHLTTLFRRTMGQSVHQYVMERRVERARQLLLAGRTSIAEVALQTGFSHQSHLATWMRRRIGVSPAKLRESRDPDVGKVVTFQTSRPRS